MKGKDEPVFLLYILCRWHDKINKLLGILRTVKQKKIGWNTAAFTLL